MIRHLRQTLSLLLSLAALAVLPSVSAQAASSGAAPRLELPAPDKSGGLPAHAGPGSAPFHQERLQRRTLDAPTVGRSALGYLGRQPRADGRRTAPSAMNRQEVLVFAALPDGVWRYEPDHALVRVLEGDRRAAMGGGSLTLLYAAPASSPWSACMWGRSTRTPGFTALRPGWAAMCTPPGLRALEGQLPLPEGWRVLIVQTVGVTR